MKLIICTFSFLFFTFNLFAQNESKEQELIELEKHWTSLLDKNDTTALKAIWMENYVVNNAMGRIVTVRDILNLIKSGHVFNKVDRKVERITFQDNLAIVMGSEIEYSKNGLETNRRFTNIWIKDSNKWKLLARQATGK